MCAMENEVAWDCGMSEVRYRQTEDTDKQISTDMDPDKQMIQIRTDRYRQIHRQTDTGRFGSN